MQKGLANASHGKPHWRWNAKKYLLVILGSRWQVRFPAKGMTTLTFRKLSPDSRTKLCSVYPWGTRSCTQTECQNKTKNAWYFSVCWGATCTLRQSNLKQSFRNTEITCSRNVLIFTSTSTLGKTFPIERAPLIPVNGVVSLQSWFSGRLKN